MKLEEEHIITTTTTTTLESRTNTEGGNKR